MKPGSAKRVTLAQVAEAAGVSVMTASYTYNQPSRVSEDARSKVLVAAGQLGYAGPDPSARSLRRGSTSTLGVVLGEHLSYAFQDPQAASFLAGIADVCADHGFGMTILPITGAADDAARIQASAVDGFVIWTTSDDDPILKAVQTTRRPAVVHGGPAVRGLGLVSIDNRAAARAVGAVAFAGAARPAVISFPLSRDRISTIHAWPRDRRHSVPGHPGTPSGISASGRGMSASPGRTSSLRSAHATTQTRPNALRPRCCLPPSGPTLLPR